MNSGLGDGIDATATVVRYCPNLRGARNLDRVKGIVDSDGQSLPQAPLAPKCLPVRSTFVKGPASALAGLFYLARQWGNETLAGSRGAGRARMLAPESPWSTKRGPQECSALAQEESPAGAGLSCPQSYGLFFGDYHSFQVSPAQYPRPVCSRKVTLGPGFQVSS
jgi:hypothetical protein